ncbi:MAG: POTRA domain-containing protein [Bacteroidota bacterium]
MQIHLSDLCSTNIKAGCWALIFCMLLPYGVHSQRSVSAISFSGLKKNKPSYLRRFIRQQPDESFDINQFEEDLQRLKNLTSVTQVSYRVDTTQNGLALSIFPEEALTLFPIVLFGGIKDNVWVQLGATDLNLFGRGIQGTAIYRNNDSRHNGQIYLRIPYLNGSKWGTSFHATHWASIEPLYFGDVPVFYEYDNSAIGATLMRELAYNHWIEGGLSYFEESYVKDDRHEGQNTPGPEEATIPKLLFKLFHSVNRINYHYYLLDGWELSQNVQAIYDLSEFNEPGFYIYWMDVKYFQLLDRFKKGNLASRFRFGLAVNRESPFAPFVLDSQVNIRGSGNRIDRGTGMLVWNLEYRRSVFEREKFAAQLVGFSDIGTWREPGGDLSQLFSEETLQHFVGGGVRFIYKKAHNAVLRIDYGIDLRSSSSRGLVLGIGQYF